MQHSSDRWNTLKANNIYSYECYAGNISITLQDINSGECSPWLIRYSSEKTIYSSHFEPWSTKRMLWKKGAQAGRLMVWHDTADFDLKYASQGANDMLLKSERLSFRGPHHPSQDFCSAIQRLSRMNIILLSVTFIWMLLLLKPGSAVEG